jgi:shikimate dehydrogenase
LIDRPEVKLLGIDLQIHAQPEEYRLITTHIKNDPMSVGGLVTTHKIDLYDACKDIFDYCDSYAKLCGEVSSISKREGRLEGHAKDPISAGLSLDAIIGKDYFERTGGQVCIFGAGGSALATLLHLINKENASDRPSCLILVNRSEGRLVNARRMVDSLATDIMVEYIHNSDPVKNDQVMETLPPFSLVINATGMGKDTPGSPITPSGVFPDHGIAWEFNYRGELDFMHQALSQLGSRLDHVEDGWLYFVHGWTQVIAQVLNLNLTLDLFERLEKVAAAVRK